jgi:hypothetical protein
VIGSAETLQLATQWHSRKAEVDPGRPFGVLEEDV